MAIGTNPGTTATAQTLAAATATRLADRTWLIVGGTDGFVRRPFLYSGFCFGFAGGATAVILVQVALWWLGGPIDELLALYNSEESLTSMAASSLIILPVFSGILGLLGAWLAVGRHLGDIEPNF